MDPDVRNALTEDLRRAVDLLADGPIDGPRRREILKACEAVRAALLGMGFDEGASRKRVVSFLRSVSLANGVIGKRTSHRLCHRTFEEDADAALKWLLEKAYMEDAGSEGFVLTDGGYQYVESHKGEFTTQPERKAAGERSSRARSPRGGREAKSLPAPAPSQPSGEKEAEQNVIVLPPTDEAEVSAT